MVTFNNKCSYNDSIKRYFPGCTASQLKHWIKPSLEDDHPDIAIIHVGTNNMTKKIHQAEMDTFLEIMDVVKECHLGGVNEIYVSSITCRPSHQERINKINKLLEQNSFKYNYLYIENGNIKPYHLRRDMLHHGKEGTIILLNNFIEYVNRSYTYNNVRD